MSSYDKEYLEFLQKIKKLQDDIGKMDKDKSNEFYVGHKYFDINDLLDKITPLLRQYDLLLIQPIINGFLCTKIICLTTGNQIESSIKINDLEKPHQNGSAITYYRRYTLKSLLSIPEVDDDGNNASLNNPKENKNNQNKDDRKWLNKFKKGTQVITKEWEETIKWIKNGGDVERVIANYKMKKELKEELKNL